MGYICSEETEELIEAVRDFCNNEVKEQSKEYDRTGEWPKEIYEKAMEMELHMLEGTAEANGKVYSCTKLPEYMQNILNQGGLIASLNREEE